MLSIFISNYSFLLSSSLGIQNVASHHINYAESYVSMKKVQYDERKNTCIITFTDGNLGQLDLNTLTQDIFKCQHPVYDLAIAHKYKKYIALCQDKSLRVRKYFFSLMCLFSLNIIL